MASIESRRTAMIPVKGSSEIGTRRPSHPRACSLHNTSHRSSRSLVRYLRMICHAATIFCGQTVIHKLLIVLIPIMFSQSIPFTIPGRQPFSQLASVQTEQYNTPFSLHHPRCPLHTPPRRSSLSANTTSSSFQTIPITIAV
jgi:hypothetical protein